MGGEGGGAHLLASSRASSSTASSQSSCASLQAVSSHGARSCSLRCHALHRVGSPVFCNRARIIISSRLIVSPRCSGGFASRPRVCVLWWHVCNRTASLVQLHLVAASTSHSPCKHGGHRASSRRTCGHTLTRAHHRVLCCAGWTGYASIVVGPLGTRWASLSACCLHAAPH